jgi:hypothetical protein
MYIKLQRHVTNLNFSRYDFKVIKFYLILLFLDNYEIFSSNTASYTLTKINLTLFITLSGYLGNKLI